jgi:hypothetical protein
VFLLLIYSSDLMNYDRCDRTRLGMNDKKGSSDYIIGPDIEKRITLKDQASKSFTFYFKKLNCKHSHRLKHLRQTYITQEDIFINSRISMQHSSYSTTSKHYVDRKEVAKQMVKNGFRIFDVERKKTLQKDTPAKKEGFTSL